MARLLLVERDLIMAGEQPDRERLESLIPFTHHRWRLLLLAWQPEQWRPTRRSVDEALVIQQQTHEQLVRWGADLDGFVYLPSPVFGRRRQRCDTLTRVIERYQFDADRCWLISSRELDVEVAVLTGVQAVFISTAARQSPGTRIAADLEQAIRHLPRD